MSISMRLKEEDELLIKKFAKMNNVSVSELIRKAVMEMIENEIDIKAFNKAVAETKGTYTIDEVKKELGI
ncbi:MAG: DUF6290 family protein [Clostridia bacterium]|jgi:hypothetical protein|nr:DUF6290 family protein [Clostridia bacterium]